MSSYHGEQTLQQMIEEFRSKISNHYSNGTWHDGPADDGGVPYEFIVMDRLAACTIELGEIQRWLAAPDTELETKYSKYYRPVELPAAVTAEQFAAMAGKESIVYESGIQPAQPCSANGAAAFRVLTEIFKREEWTMEDAEDLGVDVNSRESVQQFNEANLVKDGVLADRDDI